MPKKNNPGCNCCCTAVTVMFYCCDQTMPLASMPYTIYDPSGGVLDAGTTDSGGSATFIANRGIGTYTGSVSHARLDSTPQAIVNIMLPCPVTDTEFVQIPPAASYACGCGCMLPINRILHLTDGLLGAVTLQHQVGVPFGGVWNFTGNFPYPGCSACGCSCAAANPTRVQWLLSCVGSPSHWQLATSGGGFLGGGGCICPGGTGATFTWGIVAMGVTTCPPTFQLDGDYTFTSCGTMNTLYCNNNYHFKITE